MKPTNSIMSSYGTTVFTVMSQLAVDHNSINLGQGFPDVDGPLDIRQKAAETPAIRDALVTVFLAPPSMAELERRLRSRAEDDEEAIRKRLETAAQEMDQGSNFDHLITSETLDPEQPEKDEDLRRLLRLIEAEKLPGERF